MSSIDRDLHDPLVTDLTACRNRARSIAANYTSPRLVVAIGDISRRAQIALDRLAAATVIEPPVPSSEPIPPPAPSPPSAPILTPVDNPVKHFAWPHLECSSTPARGVEGLATRKRSCGIS